MGDTSSASRDAVDFREGAVTRPLYVPRFARQVCHGLNLAMLLEEVPWVRPRQARAETTEEALNAGNWDGATVTLDMARAWSTLVGDGLGLAFNVCFLNRYDDHRNQLGWHADDTPGMLHEHPIAVVSLGAAREIWWRPIGQTGVVPADQRQLLEDGSLFMMPAGFQRTHQHRIPKHDRPCGPRASLTFRRYVPGAA